MSRATAAAIGPPGRRRAEGQMIFACLLFAICGHSAAAVDRRPSVESRQLIVDGEPFLVQGVCYSPVPIGMGFKDDDYFTAKYAYIYRRDIPLLKALGVNTLRVYGMFPGYDHTLFLDTLQEHGMKVIPTYYTGAVSETPVASPEQRQVVVEHFAAEVARHGAHPAILAWFFGNEMNGVWNGFLQVLGDDKSYGEPCNWDPRFDDGGGCWLHVGVPPSPGSRCYNTSRCVYARLFSFIDEAARAAKAKTDTLIVSALADVDALDDKIARAGEFAPNVDFWTAQVYRGNTFGDFFTSMSNASTKPVLITEYGVDAYHDECGHGNTTPCYNELGSSRYSYEDQNTHAEYARNLTLEIRAHSSAREGCAGVNGLVQSTCASVGAFIMAWSDEFWKGADVAAACTPTIRDPAFTPANCSFKAHVTCNNLDYFQQDICGYFNGGAPDRYVNEQWFGLTTPTYCGSGQPDRLLPRKAFWELRQIWTGRSDAPEDLFDGCPEEAGFFERCAASRRAAQGALLACALLLASLLGWRRRRRRSASGVDDSLTTPLAA